MQERSLVGILLVFVCAAGVVWWRSFQKDDRNVELRGEVAEVMASFGHEGHEALHEEWLERHHEECFEAAHHYGRRGRVRFEEREYLSSVFVRLAESAEASGEKECAKDLRRVVRSMR